MNHHELKQQMYQDLRDAYFNLLKTSGINMDYVPRSSIVESVLTLPAPRFYLNSKQAAYYVLGYYRGDPYVMRYRKRELIEDLVKRYEQLRRKHPHAPQSNLWEMLVESPAPKFYVNYDHAVAIIFQYTHYTDARKKRTGTNAGCGTQDA